jgi:biotin carboxyl carrier protein
MTTERKQGYLNIDSSLYQTRISARFENRKKYEPANPKVIKSFIPGTVIELMVSPGQEITTGDDLMILDAMKMKNRIKSTIDGRVKSVAVSAGSKVSKGTVLLELE